MGMPDIETTPSPDVDEVPLVPDVPFVPDVPLIPLVPPLPFMWPALLPPLPPVVTFEPLPPVLELAPVPEAPEPDPAMVPVHASAAPARGASARANQGGTRNVEVLLTSTPPVENYRA